jgi:hypothetical protein
MNTFFNLNLQFEKLVYKDAAQGLRLHQPSETEGGGGGGREGGRERASFLNQNETLSSVSTTN